MNAPAPLLMAPIVGVVPASVEPPKSLFELKSGAVFEGGDRWREEGRRFGLFGVDACPRQTVYCDRAGSRRDGAEASLAVLAGYIADRKPVCAQFVQSAGTVLISRPAMIGSDRPDLANLQNTSGFAFAPMDGRGLPDHALYAVAAQVAREKNAGLWQCNDVEHPAILRDQGMARREPMP